MSNPKVWQLHEAKARFSELFRRVRSDGPQLVMKRRGEAVVIVSAEEYDRADKLARQPESLLEFFRTAAGGRTLGSSGNRFLGLPPRFESRRHSQIPQCGRPPYSAARSDVGPVASCTTPSLTSMYSQLPAVSRR